MTTHWRRRRRSYRRHKSVKVTLPIGLRVYCAVMVESPEPDQLPRRRWEWCRIVGADRGQYIVEEEITRVSPRKRTQELHIKPVQVPGRKMQFRWLRIGVAACRASCLWWFDGYDAVRLATELEAHAYGDGFIPHHHWRLCDGESNEVFVRDGVVTATFAE